MNQDPNRQNPQGSPNSYQQSQYPGQQPQYPGQYPQYPGGQPGFQGRPQRPGWLVPLIVVAVVGVVLSAVLIGVLIGGGMSRGPVSEEAPAAPSSAVRSVPEEEPTPAPDSTEAPAASAEVPAEPSSQAAPAKSGKVWSEGECLDEAIDWIEDSQQFIEDYAFEPLGCVDDFDGDGYRDFLAVYQAQAGNGMIYAAYCAFTFLEDGPKLLKDGVLYQEVGGNGGSLGIAKGRDGSIYLTRFTREPDGDGPHNFYEYELWDSLGETGENIYRMESQWNVDYPEKGTYLLGGKKVDKAAFEASRENYEEMYSIDIVQGHGNSEMNGVDFDTLEKWYGD